MPQRGLQSYAKIKLSPEKLDLLARLVQAEAEGEPFIGQVAVAAVVLNRVKDPHYPDKVKDVIMQVWNGYYQFSPVQNGRINRPAGPNAFRAVRTALRGVDPTKGATGFYNPLKTGDRWVLSRSVNVEIGNHIFFR
jgi:N-acetylmuramoyl-L-alanine amidase